MGLEVQEEGERLRVDLRDLGESEVSVSRDLQVKFESVQDPGMEAFQREIYVPTPTPTPPAPAQALRPMAPARKEEPQLKTSLKQRLKNREAVRNCRKRKKEQQNQLREQIEKLEELNKRLKKELLDGRGNSSAEPIKEGTDLYTAANNVEFLVDDMAKHVDLKGPKAEANLKRDVQLYLKRHHDHGRERQKAMGFILYGMKRLVQPERITKMLIYQMTQQDPSFYTDENGLWKEMCKELELSPEQEARLKSRRVHCERLKIELDYAYNKVQSIWRKAKANKKEADSLAHINGILLPQQLAKFVTWVHNQPSCKDMLNSLWDTLLRDCDPTNSPRSPLDLQVANESRVMARRFQLSSCRLVSTIFETNDPKERQRIAHLCFHPEVVILDANTKSFRGLAGIEKYVSMIGGAFERRHSGTASDKKVFGIKVKEKSLKHDQEDNDKVTSRWMITGTYTGRLVQSPRLSPESPNNPVSLDAVADFTFGDSKSPELITELFIAWDALALVGQLGIINTKDKSPAAISGIAGLEPFVLDAEKRKEEQERKRVKEEAIPPPTQESSLQAYEAVCLNLSNVFDAPVKEIRQRARRVFHQDCELSDIFIGHKWNGVYGCAGYIEVVRRLFPEMKIKPRIHSKTPMRGSTDGHKQYRIELRWDISATYRGKLPSNKSSTWQYEGTVFVECCPKTNKILVVALNIVPQDLMHQLGIVK